MWTACVWRNVWAAADSRPWVSFSCGGVEHAACRTSCRECTAACRML